jgi:glycosyl transferase family 1
MRSVYIIGAYIPNGGTFMAYHLGLIVGEYIHAKPIAVRVGDESLDSSVFEYPEHIPLIDINEFKEIGKSTDVMIMNPSFSDLGLGPHFKGFKLMYVQGYSTFGVIDGSFDSYVSVSGFVCDFLNRSYGINTPVIPPFVDLEAAPSAQSWKERPKDRVLVVTKGNATQQASIFQQIKQKISCNRPDVTFDFVPGRMKQKDFWALLSAYRYVLSLSVAEGFGLVSLESMGVGAAVIAFDAGGGTSYMLDQENCLCASYPNVDRLGDLLLMALNNPNQALEISRNASFQARTFTYDRFYNSWLNHLQTCSGLELASRPALQPAT